MKKSIFILLILAVVCTVALGVTIYTKQPKHVTTEYGEKIYYIYEETGSKESADTEDKQTLEIEIADNSSENVKKGRCIAIQICNTSVYCLSKKYNIMHIKSIL